LPIVAGALGLPAVIGPAVIGAAGFVGAGGIGAGGLVAFLQSLGASGLASGCLTVLSEEDA
jgi:predicted phage tail protein